VAPFQSQARTWLTYPLPYQTVASAPTKPVSSENTASIFADSASGRRVRISGSRRYVSTIATFEPGLQRERKEDQEEAGRFCKEMNGWLIIDIRAASVNPRMDVDGG